MTSYIIGQCNRCLEMTPPCANFDHFLHWLKSHGWKSVYINDYEYEHYCEVCNNVVKERSNTSL